MPKNGGVPGHIVGAAKTGIATNGVIPKGLTGNHNIVGDPPGASGAQLIGKLIHTFYILRRRRRKSE